jgi:hypothetical protein
LERRSGSWNTKHRSITPCLGLGGDLARIDPHIALRVQNLNGCSRAVQPDHSIGDRFGKAADWYEQARQRANAAHEQFSGHSGLSVFTRHLPGPTIAKPAFMPVSCLLPNLSL